jgi:hypothetical protein
VLRELEQLQVLNKVLDDKNTEFSFDNDNVFHGDYTQSVTLGTQVISDSERDNGSDEQQENIKIGLGGVSNKSV